MKKKKKKLLESLVIGTIAGALALGGGSAYANTSITIDGTSGSGNNWSSGIATSTGLKVYDHVETDPTVDADETYTYWVHKDEHSGDTLNMTGGSLIINDLPNGHDPITASNGTITVNNGPLTIGEYSSITSAVNLIINNNGVVNINNGAANQALVTTNDSAILKVLSGTFTTSSTSAINEAAQITIGGNTTNGTITHSSGTMTLDGTTDTWNSTGTVTVSGGTLTLKGITQNGTLTQTSGTTTIGSDQTLTSNTSVTGGNLAITGGDLTVNGANAVIGTGATINLASGKTLNIQATKTTGDTKGITFDTSDTWGGTLNQTGGLLILSGATQTGTLTKTGGTTTIGAAQTLTSNTSITGGNLDITGGDLTVNGANAVIGTGATINLAEGKTLNIQATKTTGDTKGITFDSSDTWGGTVNQTGGLFTLSGRTGTYADSTGDNQKLTLTNGTLVLDGSSLTLNAGSYIQGGTVTIDPSTLILNNGAENHAVINMQDEGSVLTIQGVSGTNVTKLTLDTGSTIVDHGTLTVGDATNANELVMNGTSSIAKEVDVILNASSITTMNGTSALTINTGDTWNGQIKQTAGTLTILNDDYTKTAATGYLTSTGGAIVIGDTDTPVAGTLKLNNTSDSIASATTVTIKSNGTLNQSAGTVTLNGSGTGADTWDGAISLSGTGNLTLDAITAVTDGTKTYNQTAGVLTIKNAGSLSLDTSDSIINATSEVVLGSAGASSTAGTLIFNNASANQALITTAGTSTDSALTVKGNSGDDVTTLTLTESATKGSNIALGTVTVGDATAKKANKLTLVGDTFGSKIAKEVTMVINENAIVDMTGAKADLTINTGDTWNGRINQTNGTLTILNDDYTKTAATGYLTSTGGAIVIGDTDTPVAGTLKLNNTSDSIASATTVTINTNGTLNESAGTVTLNASGTGADTWDGAIVLSNKGVLSLVDFSGDDKIQTDGTVKYNQTGGKATLNNTDLELAYHATAADTSSLAGGSLALTNGSKVTVSNQLANNSAVTMAAATETLDVINNSTLTLNNYTYNDGILPEELIETTITAGTLSVGDETDNTDHSTLEVSSGTIASAADVSLFEGSGLYITGATAHDETLPGAGDEIVADVTIDGTDTWLGDIYLTNTSTGNADDSIIKLTLDNVQKVIGTQPTFDNSGSMPYYEQDGGTLALTNDTYLTMTDSEQISGGNLEIDSSSVYHSLANGFSVDNLTTAGLIKGINGGYENYAVGNSFNVGDGISDSQANFTVDVYARSNYSKQYDSFGSFGTPITATNGSDAVLKVSDWTLHGDLFGADAPIDRSIILSNLFRGDVDPTQDISFISTDKEILTAIGGYKLNSIGGGNYSLDLSSYNPGVFRGQVSTLAQFENQLAISGMLFDHTMLDQGFKGNDYISSNPNLIASANDLYPPYQYSRKDGGLWVKMYGTFEKLSMDQGLKVGNNAYGTIVGADFGLKDLKHGWQFMPTAYVAYNGAHQYWNSYGAYQNGGQIGVMGTWYKNNFMIGALAYGGLYGNQMSTPRGNDNTFNYFAGTSLKTAYNWNFAKNWALQPNVLIAYNYFGEQNWYSDFGQMDMMAGMLHGINIAPGLNLIWEKETFSLYATVQYMFNIKQSVAGRAGNVELPDLAMEHGYIQYGLGVNKKFNERFSGFAQCVVRNAGRTGVGFQAGFQWKLGKGSSNNTKKSNVTPELKKTKITLSNV